MAVKVTETIYYRKLFEAACSFYESIGWKVVEKQDWGWAALEIDEDSRIGLLRHEGGGLPAPRLGIKTDDLDAEILRLRALGVDIDDVLGEKGGTRAVKFRDLDGSEVFLWEGGSGKL